MYTICCNEIVCYPNGLYFSFFGIFTENGKTLDVIHNYGHGGSGITLAYGCAIEVADMVERIMKLKHKL